MPCEVSIIIPVFNRCRLIVETLNSILNQTNLNWECILVDDGSTDDTLLVLKEYQDKDARFRVLERIILPKGAPVCRNIGFENAKGKYVVFLDSDDVLAPWLIESRLKKMNDELDFIIYPQLIFKDKIGDSNLLWRKSSSHKLDLFSFLDNRTQWQTAGAIFKTEFLLTKKIVWSEKLRSWQDWDYFIRVLNKSSNYIHFSEELPDVFIRRGNQKRISNNSIGKQWDELRQEIIQERISMFEDLKAELNNEEYSTILSQSLIAFLVREYEAVGFIPLNFVKEHLSQISEGKNKYWVILYVRLLNFNHCSGIQSIKSMGYRILRKRILGIYDFGMERISDKRLEEVIQLYK